MQRHVWHAMRRGMAGSGHVLTCFARSRRRHAGSFQLLSPRSSMATSPAAKPPAAARCPCCCRSGNGDLWFGQLVALVDTSRNLDTRAAAPDAYQWAYLRWFQNAPETKASRLLGMTRLGWATHRRPPPGGGRGRVEMPYHDLVPCADIVDPVFLQPDVPLSATLPAGEPEFFFYNHRVR